MNGACVASRAVAAIVAAGTLACGGEGSAPGGRPEQTRSTGDSPLPGLMEQDEDRLWVLVHAGGLVGYCEPGRPEWVPSCLYEEEKTVAILQANGLPSARVDHLRERAFWDWYSDRALRILDCQDEVSKPENRENSPETARDRRARQALGLEPGPPVAASPESLEACDPYRKLKNEGRLESVVTRPGSAARPDVEVLSLEELQQRALEIVREKAQERER